MPNLRRFMTWHTIIVILHKSSSMKNKSLSRDLLIKYWECWSEKIVGDVLCRNLYQDNILNCQLTTTIHLQITAEENLYYYR